MANDAFIPGITDLDVEYYLRDIDATLVAAWEKEFAPHQNIIKISKGDIFNGAPAVDAIVSPSNGFGIMNGGVDGKCKKHFGQQIENRLQEVIQTKHTGELLVGQAVLIPAYEKGSSQEKEDGAIKYFISAPTMRVVSNISATINAYLSFKAILLAVHQHNHTRGNYTIKKVLVPGLGTGNGKMPQARCAFQMLQAYETVVKEIHPVRLTPETLQCATMDQKKMCEYDGSKKPKCAPQ